MGSSSSMRQWSKLLRHRQVGSLEPIIYSQVVRGTDDNPDLPLACDWDGGKGRKCYRTESL